MIHHGGTETRSNLLHEGQVSLTVEYKGVKLDCGYRLDLVIQDAVILELKCVEHVLLIHEAQLLAYLKVAGERCLTRLN